jgi:hypothetical protein
MNKKFKALMAYLNPVGSVGINVDMFFDEIEYFGSNWVTEDGKNLKMLDIFQDFIYKLINDLARDLYSRTNEEDSAFWVDITINPRERKIKITPKFYQYIKEDEKFINFNWRDYDGFGLIDEYIDNLDLDEIKIEYNGFDGNFDHSITHIKTDKPLRFFRNQFNELISDVLNNEEWNDEGGGFGKMTLKNNEDNDGILTYTKVTKTIESGEPIIVDENYFK